MTWKKKGQLTTSPEWAKHLRAEMKRFFWRGERLAEVEQLNRETRDTFIPTVEELLDDIDVWDLQRPVQHLGVALSLTYRNRSVSTDVAMATIAEKVLASGYIPDGSSPQEDGVFYHYKRR